MTQQTRLGNYGGARAPYGSFANKVAPAILAAAGLALLEAETNSTLLCVGSGLGTIAAKDDLGTLTIRSKSGTLTA